MFKKIVSYLAYSPTLMWQLSANAKKIKKEQKQTNWIIFLAVISLLLILIATTVKTSNINSNDLSHNPKQETPANISGLTLNHTFSLGADDEKLIKPSQRGTYNLVVKNTTPDNFSGKIYFNFNDASNYLILLPETDPTISNEADYLIWTINNLPPGGTKETKMLVQSKNSFEFRLQSGFKNDCVASFVFGNTTNTEVNCGFLKQVERNFYKLNNSVKITNCTLSVFIIIILIKLAYQVENYIILKETKLIRKLINRGKV
jgi:hypothetical protein